MLVVVCMTDTTDAATRRTTVKLGLVLEICMPEVENKCHGRTYLPPSVHLYSNVLPYLF